MRKDRIEPRRPFTKPQLQALLTAALTPMERTVLLILMDTGIRRNELLGVQVADVDFQRGLLLIRGKGMAERQVAVGRATLMALREYSDGQEGRLWQLSRSGLKRMLDATGQRAGVRNVFPHRFRVTMICELLDAGADAISVSVVAGHGLDMVRYYQRAVEKRRALSQQRRYSLVDKLAV